MSSRHHHSSSSSSHGHSSSSHGHSSSSYGQSSSSRGGGGSSSSQYGSSGYRAQNPYTGYTRPEDLAEADRLYDRYAPDRDRAKTRYEDAKSYRDQTVSDGRSNKTIKKANKSMEKWKDIYDDKEYNLKEANETRRRGQHENVVRKVTDPYRVPEELNPSISKHSYRSDYRGRP